MRCSLIATTYNQSADLELYLRSLAAQTVLPDEILIADDGSGEDTRRVVERFARAELQGRLKHVWHEDLGYRKSKILNAAIRAARGEWLIFTDTDLILHPRFVADHLTMAEPMGFFMGRRVDLGRVVSDWVRARPDAVQSAGFYFRVLRSAWARNEGSQNVQRSFRFRPSAWGNLAGLDRVPDLLGSNFSISRELIVRINGFNEESEHYWGEDGDLFVRARNAGARMRGRKNFAVQWHLWHPRRRPQPEAEAKYRERLADTAYVSCRLGLTSL